MLIFWAFFIIRQFSKRRPLPPPLSSKDKKWALFILHSPLTWCEWQKVKSMNDFRPGMVKICRADFLAALITCETFVQYCENKITTLALDNNAAKEWFDSARCPIYPLDRLAQGVGFFMLEREMKVITTWISSKENTLADICSRKTLLSKRKNRSYNIAGVNLQKIPPRWRNVLKLL